MQTTIENVETVPNKGRPCVYPFDKLSVLFYCGFCKTYPFLSGNGKICQVQLSKVWFS